MGVPGCFVFTSAGLWSTWPALGITVTLGWKELAAALSQTRQVSIVVEL